MPNRSTVRLAATFAFRNARLGLAISAAAMLVHTRLGAVLAQYGPAHHGLRFALFTVAVHELLYYGLNSVTLWAQRHGVGAQYQIPRKPVQVPSAALIRCVPSFLLRGRS